MKHLNALIITAAAACLLTSCRREETGRVQGYVEGEYVYVASPLAGRLETLAVRRGGEVASGELLFALENTVETAAREEAARRLAQSDANLADARKGRRPEEIAALEAQGEQARAALSLSTKEKGRQEALLRTGAAAKQEADRAIATWEQDRQRVAQLTADLQTAKLGLRADQITAAEAETQARGAALAKADWDLAQKRQAASHAGLIFDTLYRVGEWVPAGRPVVVVLPPENIKVRAFVPEGRIGSLHTGQGVSVWVDGVPEHLAGHVSYLSPQAEYTPPVIYSRESRGKLVFLIEALFEPAIAVRLHPGQPVEVEFQP